MDMESQLLNDTWLLALKGVGTPISALFKGRQYHLLLTHSSIKERLVRFCLCAIANTVQFSLYRIFTSSWWGYYIFLKPFRWVFSYSSLWFELAFLKWLMMLNFLFAIWLWSSGIYLYLALVHFLFVYFLSFESTLCVCQVLVFCWICGLQTFPLRV